MPNNYATFEIEPLARHAQSGGTIKRPVEIACFSYDEEHKYHPDSRSLRYYYTPSIGVELSAGYETFRDLDVTDDEHLDALLLTLENLEREKGEKVDTEFVTWRGMCTKIMTAPYERFNGFEMNATIYDGTIFIEESHDYKLKSKAQQKVDMRPPRPGMPSQAVMEYFGYKFETLCLLDRTWANTSREFIENREHAVVSNYQQYCAIVSTSVGGHSLVIGGEVDAVWDCLPLPPSSDDDDSLTPPRRPIYVELKTTALPTTPGQHVTFTRKLLKFWAQSFMLSVSKLIIGFRSPTGTLLEVREMETSKLPAMVRDEAMRAGTKPEWEREVAVGFLGGVMKWLKTIVVESGDEGGVWRIKRSDRSGIVECFKVGDGHGGILSERFIKWRQELKEIKRRKEVLGGMIDGNEDHAALLA